MNGGITLVLHPIGFASAVQIIQHSFRSLRPGHGLLKDPTVAFHNVLSHELVLFPHHAAG